MDQDNLNVVAVTSCNSGDIEPPPSKKARMCNNIVKVLPANYESYDIPKTYKGYTFVDYWKKEADEANDYDEPTNDCKTYFISFNDISIVEPLSPKKPETENKRKPKWFYFPDGFKIHLFDSSPWDILYKLFVNLLEDRNVERLNYYEFVINPDDFGSTLLNCINVSNLLKQNKLYLEKKENDKYAYLRKLTEVEENVVKEMGENVNQIQTNQNITTLTYAKFHGLIKELDLKETVICFEYLYTKAEREEWMEYDEAQIEDNDVNDDVEENIKDDEDDLIRINSPLERNHEDDIIADIPLLSVEICVS
uniref:Non-structural maintenance of chromosome element 4 C-terminal domain-containing protein n=1 Tax=Panagrolaimus davidi TaxID=227884 RepID=A0A914P224_9BILA